VVTGFSLAKMMASIWGMMVDISISDKKINKGTGILRNCFRKLNACFF
jgi:hypothetical protein